MAESRILKFEMTDKALRGPLVKHQRLMIPINKRLVRLYSRPSEWPLVMRVEVTKNNAMEILEAVHRGDLIPSAKKVTTRRSTGTNWFAACVGRQMAGVSDSAEGMRARFAMAVKKCKENRMS